MPMIIEIIIWNADWLTLKTREKKEKWWIKAIFLCFDFFVPFCFRKQKDANKKTKIQKYILLNSCISRKPLPFLKNWLKRILGQWELCSENQKILQSESFF